ncbi:hypothetical protein Tco_0137004, partial [Tanacetum coccineum]
NLSSEDPIYDEVGPSYDSNTPFEVQDHDTFVYHMDEYHEVHEMQSDVQHNYVVDSEALIALAASADVPSSVTETTDTTSTLQPPRPPLQTVER